MTDIALTWNSVTQRGDLAIANGDFVHDDGLLTAVAISLFTDGPAQDGDEIPDGTINKRGYWANQYLEYPFVSRLWLLDRAKQVDETLRRAEHYADEALAWMLKAQVAKQVTSTATFPRAGMILLRTEIVRPDDRRWQQAWEIPLNG